MSTTVQFDFATKPVPEEVARRCASLVGVPYGTDNITDSEWERFKRCVTNYTR